MAAVKSEDPATGPANSMDPLDIEQYLNPDAMAFTSPSLSPNPSSSMKSSTVTTPTIPSQPLMPPPAEQTFSGPSHRYEQYRQQSSLPVGAVTNTLAFNESNTFYDQDSYDMIPTHELYYGMNGADEYVDFPSGSGMADLEMDFNSPPSSLSQMGNVNPTAIGNQPGSQSSSSQHVRAWPGMHQQAAMQAKAQAKAQEKARQESVSQSRASSAGRQTSTDPHVEESISRLLNRMRHSSVSSSQGEDQAANSDGNASRLKKDEEDMDEDERLLASEEGKKLSSKERRQLRNKVSARAFRSRRKEYIGQLEGELAAKTAEADRLRIKNDTLVSENTRLTDLTRMLLSSPHFSNFLEELSATGGSMPSLTSNVSQRQPQQASQSQQQQQRLPKDANPNIHQQSNMHVGLAMIPEEPYNMNDTQQSSASWGPSNTIGYDQQVYAVTSLPEEPLINTNSLSGKSLIEPLSSFGSSKEDMPSIKAISPTKSIELPSTPRQFPEQDDTSANDHKYDIAAVDPSDPMLSLYVEQPASTISAPPCEEQLDPEDRIFGMIPPEKAFNRLELIVEDREAGKSNNIAIMMKFARLRSVMNTIGARIDSVTGHL